MEQIGHVYEGLLDHTAVRADEIVLGLEGSRDKEPEVRLSSMIAEQAKGQERFAAWLAENTGRTENAVRKSLSAASDSFQIQRLKSACGNDARVFDQVAPFAGLIRADDFETPMVILQGNVYVTAGVTRRATGTHYTPRSLTEPVVQHTLEPLVYIGVAEGLPREAWKLRTAAEILAIKVCDMAMGSAGFLVQADRYLAERLMEAWVIASEGGIQITPDGMPSKGLPGETLLPKDEDERMILARRLVADRCLYGVDKNPLAVEIAKLSLWLTTMAKGRPFSFLDHALKCGDSLVGASADDFLRWAHGYQNSAMTLFDEQLRLQLETARQKRRELEAFEVKDVRDSELKAALLKEADAAMAHIKRGCDLLTGARLLGLSEREIEELRLSLLFPYMKGELDGDFDAGNHPDTARALNVAKRERAFHWEFEFPEVFENGGFSVVVGNPPFMGGRIFGVTLGKAYQDFISVYRNGRVGSADLCVYFLLKAFQLLKTMGCLGLITTNSISDTGNRYVGLDQLSLLGGVLYHAISQLNWPGKAAVVVSVLHVIKGEWIGEKILDSQVVQNISSNLDALSENQTVYALKSMSNRNSQGLSIMGKGFILDKNEKDSLIDRDSKNKEVIYGYFNGDDLNNLPELSPRRWIINFGNMSEEVAEQYAEPFARVKNLVKPFRDGLTGQIHEKCYWKFWDKRPKLQKELETHDLILVCAVVTKYLSFQFVTTKMNVYDHKIKLLFFYTFQEFSVLQSNFHDSWARWRSGKLGGTTTSYSTSESLDTFPFPLNVQSNSALSALGENYHTHRSFVMKERQEGLTDVYNRFHNPKESAEDIVRLRELHVEMDRAVTSAYGWDDLDLGHGFHETAQGVRFTISEAARREVLSRLLKLNHERWEEEQRMKDEGGGMKEEGKKKKAVRKKPKSNEGQMGLL